jgi:hypothetical protein
MHLKIKIEASGDRVRKKQEVPMPMMLMLMMLVREKKESGRCSRFKLKKWREKRGGRLLLSRPAEFLRTLNSSTGEILTGFLTSSFFHLSVGWSSPTAYHS